jgi:hypothetical protein
LLYLEDCRKRAPLMRIGSLAFLYFKLFLEMINTVLLMTMPVPEINAKNAVPFFGWLTCREK